MAEPWDACASHALGNCLQIAKLRDTQTPRVKVPWAHAYIITNKP